MTSAAVPVSEIKFGLKLFLQETFERVHGMYLDKGTALFETLAGIDAATASRPVSPTCATLAAQIEHVRYYLDVLGEMMAGTLDQSAVDWRHIWNTVSAVTPDEWAASQARLRTSYDRIVAQIDGWQTIDGERQLGGAIAIIAHTAYHLGEIRQALCTLSPAGATATPDPD